MIYASLGHDGIVLFTRKKSHHDWQQLAITLSYLISVTLLAAGTLHIFAGGYP
jgi:hypothetical protein